VLHLIADDPDAHGTRVGPDLSPIDWRILAEVVTEPSTTREVSREVSRTLSSVVASLRALRAAGYAERIDGTHRYIATAAGRRAMARRLRR